MKYSRTYIAALFVIVAVLVTAGSFRLGRSRAQAQSKNDTASVTKSTKEAEPKVESRVKNAVAGDAVTQANSKIAANSFASAAAQNAVLRTDLTWVFGGKQQRGWYLYTSLINRLLNTDAEPVSDDFAASLSHWQNKNGLPATGVLDGDSFRAIFSAWQSARLKDRSYAQPNQLLTAPPSDFYDPSRADNLRQVERETYAAYKRMIAAALNDPSLELTRGTDGGLAPTEKFLKIVSAFRPREYQDELRRKSPNAGSAGLAVNSPHFTGKALDLYVGGDPVETKDPNRAIQVQTPVYKWLVQNAERFGFRPYFYEPWHWEYVGP